MNKTDKLNDLQAHLAKDLVSLEDVPSVTEEQLDEITHVYSDVYDIISQVKSL